MNFLANHPTDRFTLSEIAREVGLNKATLHAILGTLVDAGYLVRDDSRKTYGLGPALIALGGAALESNPAVLLARPEMHAVSDELHLDCIASTAVGDEIVILARTSPSRPFGIAIQAGQRLPMAPPLGTVFVAWSSPERIDRWLSLLGPSASKADLKRYREAVDSVRRRGYSVGLEAAVQPRLARTLNKPERRGRSLEERVRTIRTEEYALVELDHSASYRLNHVGAPVFGPDGRVVIALFLIGFHGDIPSDEVPRYAERLMLAASRVTDSIGGREPQAS